MMSPLAEKRWPSRSDRARPAARERSRISVEPSVPAASTTISARHAQPAVAAPLRDRPSSRSKCTCQRPSPRLGHVAHLGVGEDLRAVARRLGQVGERHGVLGADVAAAAAVAAARAGGLGDAGRVDGTAKLTTTGAATGCLAERRSGVRQRLVLGPLGRCLGRAPAAPSGPRARSPRR